MLKKEMNERLIFHLKDFFAEHGFRLKKTNEMILFKNKRVDGYTDMGISSSNFYDSHQVFFGYSKRVNRIEEVMVRLQEFFSPNLFLLRNDSFTYSIHGFDVDDYKKTKFEVSNERDVLDFSKKIIDFSIKRAFVQFDYLENINNVDKIINGKDFWVDEKNKPFVISRFDVRRIVIAKLAKTPVDYTHFQDKLLAIEDKRIEDIRQSDEKYKDLKNWFVPKIFGHLEDIVK